MSKKTQRLEYLAWVALVEEQIRNNNSQIKAMRREIEAIEYLNECQENSLKKCEE